jgi:hypothetical protein
VVIIIAGAAAGTVASVATRRPPGFLLGLFVVAATVCAALAVRPTAVRMILPVPALSYLVAALGTGLVTDRPADHTRTAELIAATQWIADGFFAMALATALAVVLTAVRWYLWRRGRKARQVSDRAAPPPAPGRGRRDEYADYGDRWEASEWAQSDPRGDRWVEEDPRRPGQRGAPQGSEGSAGGTGAPAGRRPRGPQSGSGPSGPRTPYNFSSGA